MIMDLYIGESLTLRVQKLENTKGANAIYRDILDTFLYDAANYICKNANDAIYSSIEGEEADKLTKAIKTLTTVKGVNTKEARRRIANKVIEDNVYKF